MLPIAEKFTPVELAQDIVFAHLRQVGKVDSAQAGVLFTKLVELVTLTRFFQVSAVGQVRNVWREIRQDDALVDLVLQCTVSLKFRTNIGPTTQDELNNRFGDILIPTLVKSFGTFTGLNGPLENSVIDEALGDRLCTAPDLQQLIEANNWLVLLMLLSMSPRLMEWKP